jgi:hypothetical protein
VLSGRRAAAESEDRKLDYAGIVVGRLISTAVHIVVCTVVGDTVCPGLTIGESVHQIAMYSIGSIRLGYSDTRDDSSAQRFTAVQQIDGTVGD